MCCGRKALAAASTGVSALIAVAAAVALLRWKVGVLPLLAGCATAGLVARLVIGPTAGA